MLALIQRTDALLTPLQLRCCLTPRFRVQLKPTGPGSDYPGARDALRAEAVRLRTGGASLGVYVPAAEALFFDYLADRLARNAAGTWRKAAA